MRNKALNSEALVFCSFIPTAVMPAIKIHTKEEQLALRELETEYGPRILASHMPLKHTYLS